MTALLLKPIRQTRNDGEFRLTVAVADHLRLSACPGVVWAHLPNGEHRSARTGARLKRMGVRRGLADFLIKAPGEPAGMLELKVHGNRPTPEQKAFGIAWEEAGGQYAVATGIDEALDILRGWKALPRDFSYVPARRRQMPLPIEEVA